ncbi:PHD finger protein rhinoceros [Plodia interpunctella]|uniref:PHD finger protein rhinoceros n=1 Tax=Plodia interpunctella TaxID=58824 RepID=UPI0023686C56|nr:PHD finger protein rhinoceros [Plodia interpunctella]XP_053623699.1 PHD finger protein rhinoceros [Plodia interpunctella]XP_053623700.1 PHD finger protein rhinoceros [Plodia interpunctella]
MSVRGTKRATGVRGEEAGTSKRRRTEPEDALWQLRPDVKMPSIYNRSASEAPAELFRKDLISAMKLPDSEPLTASEYWVITDTWKQDWERGVQVPVNPDSLPAPKVKIIDNPKPPDFQEFKLPKDKYIHLTRDAHFQPDKHHLSTTPARAEAACSYDLDAIDTAWLKLLNAERARAGAMPINENQLEKVLEELEVRTWDKIQAIMKSEEGLGIEYDENVICDVCRSPDSEDGNEMVFCDSCNICVHQACYGITVIPDGQWLCRPCGDGVRPMCVLCPNVGGAMKCTPSGHKWAHVSCVLWIPEVSIGCAERMEPITKISAIPASRWSLLCVLCRERKGACIQCSVKTCKTAYHVTCAFKHGLEMRAIIEDENADDGVKLRSYCQKHSVNNKKDKSSGSGSDEEEVKRKRRKDMTSEEKTQARAARLQEIEHEFDRHVSIKDISSHLLDVDQDAIVYIYNYWKLKRRAGHNRPLLPPKSDDSELLTHRQEQADLDKMKMFVQLRQDLERVRNLCYMVSRREKLSRSFFRLREQTFHKQVAVLTADPSISGPELAAIIEANHGPSIYDRLYSHDNAPDHQNDFEALLARIAPPDSSDDKKKDRNGLVKGSKSANPYKRHYVNGSRRSGSMYSGLSSEESAPEISRSSKYRGRAIGSSTDDDGKKSSSPKKKVSPKTKGKRSPKKTERKKKKVPQSKAILESSSEDESLKAKMKKDRTRSKTLTQMEKEMTAGKIDQSGTDSDELMPMRTTRNNKFPVDIYSDSSEEDVKPEVSDKTKSSEKSKANKSPNDSQQPLPRTKAAMKEFILHPEKKPVPEEVVPKKKRGRKPSNKDKKPPPPVKVESEDEARNKENKAMKQKDNPTDLIVPQRQAAKKASENMRSTTVVKKDDSDKPVSGDDTKSKPKVKSRGKEVKDTKDVTPSTSPAKVGRKKSSKEAEKEPISYVPQRQAAKKAAAHIKSGLGSKLPVVESDTDKKKDDKTEFMSPKKEEVKSKPLPKDSSSSSSSSSSSCSSSSSSEEETEKPCMKPTAKAPEIKPARQPSMFSPPGSRPTVDLPFLDKVSRPLSSTSASSDGDSSKESRSGSDSPALKLPRRRRKGSRLSSDTSPRKAPDKKLKTSERRSECGVPSPIAEGEEPRGADARAATRARTRSTTSSGNMPNKPDTRPRKPTKDDAGFALNSNKTKESFQSGQLSSPKREEDEEIKKEIKNDMSINDVKPKIGRPKSRSISVEDKEKIKSSITDSITQVKTSPRKSIDSKQKSRRMSVKDTSPIRRLSVKDTSPNRRTAITESSPISRIGAKDTLPSRRMSMKDISPNRRMSIKESPPKRRMSIKEPSPSRRSAVKDSSPNRRVTVKDPSPNRRVTVKDPSPSSRLIAKERRMSIKDPSPRRRMSVKDSSPKRRMSVKDTSPKHMDSLISDPTANVAPVKERRISRAEILSATGGLSPVKKLISERQPKDLNLERKSPLPMTDFTDHDKHWLTAPSPLCPPPVIERPGLNDKYIGEDKSMDSDSADKSSVNMMAKIQANLNENTMIKSPKTPMDARVSMDPLEMESSLVRGIRKRVSIDPEKKFITQDASHVQGVEISKSAKIPSVANPFPNRSMFSPQSKDNELFDYDMIAVDDGFNHDDMTKPFSSYPEFIFKEDSKEQGVQETLNLVDRLRMQLSSKKIPTENPVQEEPMNVEKDQKDDENNMTSKAGEGETLPPSNTAFDLPSKHIPKDSRTTVNHVAPPYCTDLTPREPITDKNYQEPIAMTSKDKWADIPLPDEPHPNDRKYDNHSNSYHEEVKEPSTIQSDVQSVSEIGDTISLSKQSDDSQSLSVADHSMHSNDQELTQDNQTYDNNNSLAHSDCATISSPYIGQDPKYRGESKITTRRSSASSTTSEGSTCSQKPVMKSHLNSIDSHQGHVIPDIDLYPLPAYSCSVVEPAMPLNQYSAFAPDASPFISSALPLFTSATGQLALPSPGPGLFPPVLPFPTTSLSSLHTMQPKPAFPQLCATFTTSSQNIALTTAMIAPPTPKPIDSPRDDLDVSGSDKFSIHVVSSPSISVDSYDASNNRSTKMSNDSNETMSSMHPQESKSPPKLPPAKTTPKFTGKSPGKSPAGISPKQSEPQKGTKRANNRSNRSQRGRGRSKSRGQSLQGYPVDYMGNSIQNKLVGTVYDFDEEIANDGVDLKALRDRRKSIDIRDDRKSENSYKDASQSPPVASPQANKRPPPSEESKEVKPSSPEVRERTASPAGKGSGDRGPGFTAVAPVLPGPVDMRTYQPFENPVPAAGDAYLLEFASGTADQQLAEIDEEIEKQLHSALMASKPKPGSPSAPVAPKPTEPPKETFTPQLPKVSLSDSRNQLKVKIKGPFLDANYSASSVTPVVPTPPVPVHDPISSFNAASGTPSSMMSGSGLRRMRKKELLRQYWTQDMNQDDPSAAAIMGMPQPPAQPPPLARTVTITIPKAVASMTSIPTREDYKMCDTPIEKKKRKTTSGLSRELRHLAVSMNDDVDPTDETKLPSYTASQAYKRRGRVTVKPNANNAPAPVAPKLKIKLSSNSVQQVNEESSGFHQFRPPKKRLMNLPKPSMEDVRRENMKFRRKIMADFEENEKTEKHKPPKSDKRKKKKDKKAEKLQVINSESESATKLIIKIKRTKEEESGQNSREGALAAAAAAPEAPVVVDPFEYDPSAPDPLAIDPPSYSDSSAMRKIRTDKVTPIRLKLSRSSKGSGYVMKESEEPSTSEAPSTSHSSPLPIAVNKHCEVR